MVPEICAKSIAALERDILTFIAPNLRKILINAGITNLTNVEEIRLRAEKPLMIQETGKEWILDSSGRLVHESVKPYRVSQQDIISTLELMSENSIYAFQEEIRSGFLTLRGGHRIGIAGRIVIEGTAVRNIKDISGLNIRVSREVAGCASGIIRYIIAGDDSIYNTLIVSPPQCGKTTMLRDLARILGNGDRIKGIKGYKVGVVDERSELAACYRGVPQNSVGDRTDVLDGCPKSLGMIMMLRSMSPEVIITDEIGGHGDSDAIMQLINAGVKIITTAHGYSISELKTRQEVLNLMKEKVFDRYIVLSRSNGPGTIEEVVDGSGSRILGGLRTAGMAGSF